MPHRVIAVVTDELHGEDPLEQICRNVNGEGVDVRVVVPAIEAGPLEHTLGDIDEPRHQAEERLERLLRQLRRRKVPVRGEVGDPDPVQAAQDALLKGPADEVLIFEHCDSQRQWYENGLLERAQEEIEPPLRMVFLESADGQGDRVTAVEERGAGTVNQHAGKEVGGGAYVPGMTRDDLAGMVAGIAGTVVVAVLAAAITAETDSGWEAVAILIAIGVALANLAHVVGLTLFETVRYHGGFAKFFRTLALVGTPLAIVIDALILIFAV